MAKGTVFHCCFWSAAGDCWTASAAAAVKRTASGKKRSCLAQNGGRFMADSVQQFIRVADGHGQVGTSETVEDGEVHPDDLALVIEKRSARAAGSGCGVVHNLVLQHVPDMALRGGRPDQALLRQPGDNLGHAG